MNFLTSLSVYFYLTNPNGYVDILTGEIGNSALGGEVIQEQGDL